MCCGDLTIVFGEAHVEVSFLDLLNEHVFLVEEEYDGGGGEVAVVADTVEQVQTFVHSILKRECAFSPESRWRAFQMNQLLIAQEG